VLRGGLHAHVRGEAVDVVPPAPNEKAFEDESGVRLDRSSRGAGVAERLRRDGVQLARLGDDVGEGTPAAPHRLEDGGERHRRKGVAYLRTCAEGEVRGHWDARASERPPLPVLVAELRDGLRRLPGQPELGGELGGEVDDVLAERDRAVHAVPLRVLPRRGQDAGPGRGDERVPPHHGIIGVRLRRSDYAAMGRTPSA